MTEKYRPFSTGSQYGDWSGRNCDSCKKGFNRKKDVFRCEWEMVLCRAYIYDGQVTEEVAKAIGYFGNEECYIWECPGWKKR